MNSSEVPEEMRVLGDIARKCGFEVEYNIGRSRKIGFLSDGNGISSIRLSKDNTLFGINTIHFEDGVIVLLRWSADGHDVSRSKRISLHDPFSLDILKEELCGEFS